MGRLTVPQGAALSTVAVLGTGVIALPALAAQIAGPASLVAWAGLLLLAIPLAATFAALGARYPDAGGVSTYVRRAFGTRAAAVVGWCFYSAVPAGAPAAAMFGGAYVSATLGGGMRTTVVTASVLVILATVINAAGLQVSGRVQLGLAVLLVTLLLSATVTALPHASLGNLQPFAPNGWGAIVPAAAVLIWAFAGWEAVTSLAADFRRPERDVPRATVIALVVVGLLYLGVACATVLVLGSAAGSTEAPLADLLARGIGGPASALTMVAALLLTLGAINAYFAGAAKLGSALGRDGALPAWFARGSAAGEVPRRSLSVVAGLSLTAIAIVAVTGVGPRPSVLVMTGSIVAVYVLATAAAVRLLPARSRARRTAVVALVSAAGLFLTVGVYALWALLVASLALAYVRRRRRATDQEDDVSRMVSTSS